MGNAPIIPMGDGADGSDAAGSAAENPSARPWQTHTGLSSIGGFAQLASAGLSRAEDFLAQAGFHRGPWLAVAFACGILAWFSLPWPWQWIAAIESALLVALTALAVWPAG